MLANIDANWYGCFVPAPCVEHWWLQAGENVSVKKHSSMGCAVITLRDTRVRDVRPLIIVMTCVAAMSVEES
eukprot:3854109-Amphidinium_carterae.1